MKSREPSPHYSHGDVHTAVLLPQPCLCLWGALLLPRDILLKLGGDAPASTETASEMFHSLGEGLLEGLANLMQTVEPAGVHTLGAMALMSNDHCFGGHSPLTPLSPRGSDNRLGFQGWSLAVQAAELWLFQCSRGSVAFGCCTLPAAHG